MLPPSREDGSARGPGDSRLSLLRELSSVIVALSGGADSAYLAWAAQRALAERALSVTAVSPSLAASERIACLPFNRTPHIHDQTRHDLPMHGVAMRQKKSP